MYSRVEISIVAIERVSDLTDQCVVETGEHQRSAVRREPDGLSSCQQLLCNTGEQSINK